MIYLGIAIAAMSLILFVVMGVDKQKAIHHQWRVKERTLILLAALGGALGGCLGMLVFRHKTKHALFVICFPLFLLLQAAAVYLLWKNGVLQ